MRRMLIAAGLRVALPALAMLLVVFSTMANAHIPARCDPLFDHFIEAIEHTSIKIDAVRVWLDDMNERGLRFTRDDLTNELHLYRAEIDAYAAQSEASFSLLQCILK